MGLFTNFCHEEILHSPQLGHRCIFIFKVLPSSLRNCYWFLLCRPTAILARRDQKHQGRQVEQIYYLESRSNGSRDFIVVLSGLAANGRGLLRETNQRPAPCFGVLHGQFWHNSGANGVTPGCYRPRAVPPAGPRQPTAQTAAGQGTAAGLAQARRSFRVCSVRLRLRSVILVHV